MWDTPEDAFSELDKARDRPIAKALAKYRDALTDEGFSPAEAFALVEQYGKYLFEWALESIIRQEHAPYDEEPEDDEPETIE